MFGSREEGVLSGPQFPRSRGGGADRHNPVWAEQSLGLETLSGGGSAEQDVKEGATSLPPCPAPDPGTRPPAAPCPAALVSAQPLIKEEVAWYMRGWCICVGRGRRGGRGKEAGGGISLVPSGNFHPSPAPWLSKQLASGQEGHRTFSGHRQGKGRALAGQRQVASPSPGLHSGAAHGRPWAGVVPATCVDHLLRLVGGGGGLPAFSGGLHLRGEEERGVRERGAVHC